MPRVIIQMVEGRSREKKRALVKNVTAAVSQSLGISQERVSVAIHELKEENLAHGGVLWCDRQEKPPVPV